MVDFTKALLIAMILFSIYSAMETLDDDSLENLASATDISVGEKVGYFGLWAQSLNNLVPAKRFNSPFWDGYIVGLNDIPFFDATDLIIMIPVLWLPIFILKRKWRQNPAITNKLKIIFIIIILTFITFLLAKFLLYHVYLYSAQKIGLTVAEAIAVREGFLANTEGVSTPLLMVSLYGGIAILYSYNKKGK